MKTSITKPKVLPVAPDAIPSAMKELTQWVVWRADIKSDGRISKVPVDRYTGRAVSAQNPANHLRFYDAMAAYETGTVAGIGIVLTGEPVYFSDMGVPQYLVGVDFDKVTTNHQRTEALLKPLRGIYVERSPSGSGLRLFCLSRQKPRSGQGDGAEMYAQGRFLTVTGQKTRGSVIDCTAGVKALEQILWPPKTSRGKIAGTVNDVLCGQMRIDVDDTPRQRAQLVGILSHISADCAYERYRDVVWSVLSLGWHDAEAIAEQWCRTAPKRFDEASFATLINSYDPERTPTIGTLIHFARIGGWNG